jgi:hypothetical protein
MFLASNRRKSDQIDEFLIGRGLPVLNSDDNLLVMSYGGASDAETFLFGYSGRCPCSRHIADQ